MLRVEEEQIVVDKYSAEGGVNLGTVVRLMPVSETSYTGIIIAAAAVLVIAIVAVIVAKSRKREHSA